LPFLSFRKVSVLLRKSLRPFLGFLVGGFSRFLLQQTKTELLVSGAEDRIGHLVVEPLFLELDQQFGSRDWNRVLVLWDPQTVANQSVFESLPKRFVPVANPLLRWFLNKIGNLASYRSQVVSVKEAIGSHQNASPLFALLGKASKEFDFFQVTDEEEKLKVIKDGLGIPFDRWVCCFHVRENVVFADGNVHSYRDSSLENMIPSLEEIVSAGGVAIRLGFPESVPMPTVAGVIDLAHHPNRSAESDFILSRGSRFFLGNSSGVFTMAASAGVPIVAVNNTPLGDVKVWGPRDLAIPKLYRNLTTRELEPFEIVFRSGVSKMTSSRAIADAGYEVIENSAEEIRQVVLEMMGVVDGSLSYSRAEKIRQEVFQKLFPPDNYSYHSGTKVGKHFLYNYRHLLPSD